MEQSLWRVYSHLHLVPCDINSSQEGKVGQQLLGAPPRWVVFNVST